MKTNGILATLDRSAAISLIVLLIVLLAARIVVDLDNRSLAISVDASIESLLPSEGETLEAYEDVRDKFVGDDFLVAVWISDELFSPNVLKRFKQFTLALNQHPDVTDDSVLGRS